MAFQSRPDAVADTDGLQQPDHCLSALSGAHLLCARRHAGHGGLHAGRVAADLPASATAHRPRFRPGGQGAAGRDRGQHDRHGRRARTHHLPAAAGIPQGHQRPGGRRHAAKDISEPFRHSSHLDAGKLRLLSYLAGHASAHFCAERRPAHHHNHSGATHAHGVARAAVPESRGRRHGGVARLAGHGSAVPGLF